MVEFEMRARNLSLILAALLLSACTMLGQATPTPLPTIVLDRGAASPQQPVSAGAGVTASAVTAPALQAQLSFAISGKLEAVLVEVGDTVRAGQTLARLQGQESLQAAVRAAEFELQQAEQALADLDEQAELAKVQAMQQMVTFAQAVKEAQYRLDNFTVPANQVGLDPVEALKLMKERLDQARLAFEPYRNRPENDPTRQALKEALDTAQSDYNAAVRRLQLAYDLEVAQTQFARAQRDFETYSKGPDPDQRKLAQARLENAQAQLVAAQAALQNLELKAPFDGVVAVLNLRTGEWVLPGQPVLILADLAHLRVETTDLSERDIPQVSVGKSASIYIKALNLTLPGKVLAIAPLATTLGGDVVYKVTLELQDQPAELRAGMSAVVTFTE